MKIGILTFHCAHNYGAVLQCYALQQYLKGCGHEVSVIDYRPKYLLQGYEKFSLRNWLSPNLFRTIKKLLAEPFLLKDRIRRWNEFNEFICGFNLYPINKFKEGKGFDKVIYGSDQIWNAFLTGGKADGHYWGQYSPHKSISYAASMGEYRPSSEEIAQIQSFLNSFLSLSVREQEIQELLQPLTSNKIELVCDPVFLLSRDQWDRLLTHNSVVKPYVLCYNLFRSPECRQQAEVVSKQLGIELIEIAGSVTYDTYKSDIVRSIGPLAFVEYIKEASFVVTSSFHGTAFSLIFQRPFYVMGLKQRAGRVQSLLKIANLESRLLTCVKTEIVSEVDYTSVEKNMKSYIAHSKTFIDESLKNEIQ